MVPHHYYGRNVDQVKLDPKVPAVQNYFVEFALRKIDEGADGFRADLLHLWYMADIKDNKDQPIYKIIQRIKARKPDVFFIAETYEQGARENPSTEIQAKMLELGVDRVYSKRFFESSFLIARGGKSAQELNDPVGAAVYGDLPILAYLSNLDQISLEAIGICSEALVMLSLVVAYLRPEKMWFLFDWEDFLRLWGKIVRIVGGGIGSDATDPHSHLFARTLHEVLIQMHPERQIESFMDAPIVKVFKDFAAAFAAVADRIKRQTWIVLPYENAPSNEDPDRFYTLAWEHADYHEWTLLTIDVRPGKENKNIWIRVPAKALMGRSLDMYDVVDLLDPDAKYELKNIGGVPAVTGVSFPAAGQGRPYRILSLQLKPGALLRRQIRDLLDTYRDWVFEQTMSVERMVEWVEKCADGFEKIVRSVFLDHYAEIPTSIREWERLREDALLPGVLEKIEGPSVLGNIETTELTLDIKHLGPLPRLIHTDPSAWNKMVDAYLSPQLKTGTNLFTDLASAIEAASNTDDLPKTHLFDVYVHADDTVDQIHAHIQQAALAALKAKALQISNVISAVTVVRASNLSQDQTEALTLAMQEIKSHEVPAKIVPDYKSLTTDEALFESIYDSYKDDYPDVALSYYQLAHDISGDILVTEIGRSTNPRSADARIMEILSSIEPIDNGYLLLEWKSVIEDRVVSKQA